MDISHITLAPRGLFSSDKNFTCARPIPNQHGKTLSIGISSKSLLLYITLACLGLTTISSLVLQWKHLHRYTMPKEQRQIIRMVWLPVFFCIISTLAVAFYDQSIYLEPVKEVYEAFCIAALFLLYVEYVCPDEHERPAFFTKLENKDKKGNIIPGGSLVWWHRTFAMVLQYPLTKTISAIVEIATQAGNVYCPNSFSPKYAHIWIELINFFIIGGAVSAVFKFYGKLKTHMDPKHHALAKIVSFKGLIFFQFLQGILFGFLNGKVFKPTDTMTYDDIYYGIPNMLTAIEALCFSLLFHWAFRSREYHEEERAGLSRMPIWRAAIDALNLSDIVIGIITAFKLLIMRSSPNGHGFSLPAQFGAAPKRQRTMEMRDEALEPLKGQPPAYQPALHPPTNAYYNEDLGAQRTGHARNVSNSSETEMLGGYGAPEGEYREYRDQYLGVDQNGRSRSPSPNGRLARTPRDMV